MVEQGYVYSYVMPIVQSRCDYVCVKDVGNMGLKGIICSDR